MRYGLEYGQVSGISVLWYATRWRSLSKDSSLAGKPMKINEILNEQFKSVSTIHSGHREMNKSVEFFATSPVTKETIIL